MTYKYINEDQIDIELKCTICDEPFQSPMNCTLCGNTYCQSCVIQWLKKQVSCPSCRKDGNNFQPVLSRIVINQLNRLLVQCTLCQQRNIQRSNFNDHISCTCPKYIVECKNKCGWKGFRENSQEHLNECGCNQFFGINISWQKAVAILILAILFYWMLRK